MIQDPNLLTYVNEAIDETKVLVRQGPTKVHGLVISNSDDGIIYLQLFDAASTAEVTLGTTVGKITIGVPAGESVVFPPQQLATLFGKGLVIAYTENLADSTAADVDGALTVFYSIA